MISFKILTEESAEELFGEICSAIPDTDGEFLSENIDMMLDDESEYALSHSDGCLLVRIFEGEYSFAYPIAMVDDAEPMAAVEQIRLYAIKEEIPLVFCDVPAEELGSLITKFRHASIDATDPDNECYTVRIMSEVAMLDNIPIVNGPAEVCLTPITEADDELYFALATDLDTNKYWGYDYREDEPNPEKAYFRENSSAEFSRGTAISLAVFRVLFLQPLSYVTCSGNRYAAHMDIHSAHVAAGHSFHSSRNSLLGVFSHFRNGSAILHGDIHIQHQSLAAHIDANALQTLLCVLAIAQFRNTAHAGHHAGHTLYIPDGAHHNGSNDFFRDMDTAVFFGQDHIILILGHGEISPFQNYP